MPTPKNQMDKKTANGLFKYKDGSLYWREAHSRRVDISKPAGSKHHSGYRRVKLSSIQYQTHNIIWNLFHGFIPCGYTVDHIDRDPSNNSIENLRLLTFKEQGYNVKLNKRNISGMQGVVWVEKRKKWQVYYEEKYLGVYSDIDSAKKARSNAESQSFKVLRYNKEAVTNG